MRYKYVFTVDDIFDAIVSDSEEIGLMYNGKKYKERYFRMAKNDGIAYYEILHPCRSPGIKVKEEE